jgi:hypothetical protein
MQRAHRVSNSHRHQAYKLINYYIDIRIHIPDEPMRKIPRSNWLAPQGTEIAGKVEQYASW